MLSRVADSLFWLGRYVERAENLARLVDVNHYASLDITSQAAKQYGQRLIYTTNSEEAFKKAQDKSDIEIDINHFIIFSSHNPNSILECIAYARNNARMVRDQISTDMWLELNSIHLFLQSAEALAIWHDDPQIVLRQIINFSLLFQGLTHATNLHDEGWNFVQLGRFIERADKTSRILDTLTYADDIRRGDIVSILHSCSGFAAFNREFKAEATLKNATKFLLRSPDFPRSVRFCLSEMDALLHAISTIPAGHYSNEAERLTGKLLAQLNFTDSKEIKAIGLHKFIDDIQNQLNEIGNQIFENYVLLPSELQETTSINKLPGQHQHQ